MCRGTIDWGERSQKPCVTARETYVTRRGGRIVKRQDSCCASLLFYLYLDFILSRHNCSEVLYLEKWGSETLRYLWYGVWWHLWTFIQNKISFKLHYGILCCCSSSWTKLKFSINNIPLVDTLAPQIQSLNVIMTPNYKTIFFQLVKMRDGQIIAPSPFVHETYQYIHVIKIIIYIPRIQLYHVVCGRSRQYIICRSLKWDVCYITVSILMLTENIRISRYNISFHVCSEAGNTVAVILLSCYQSMTAH